MSVEALDLYRKDRVAARYDMKNLATAAWTHLGDQRPVLRKADLDQVLDFVDRLLD